MDAFILCIYIIHTACLPKVHRENFNKGVLQFFLQRVMMIHSILLCA